MTSRLPPRRFRSTSNVPPANQRKIQASLLAWFARAHRDLPWRNTSDPYAIWVSEVMLQQTQVATVIPYYHRWLQAFPTVTALARAPQDDVLKVWEGLGYYARARNFHRAAQHIVDRFHGVIPDDAEDFINLDGVGTYTCAAVMSIAFGKPLAAVDGNVKRVLSRLFVIENEANDARHSKVFQAAADELLDRNAPGAFNQAMMELGALVCRPQNPQCEHCPVSSCCLAFAEKKQFELPRRKQRKPTPQVQVAVGVVADRGKVLITRRPEDGLLGGLWEFPGGKIEPPESPREACKRELREETGLEVAVGKQMATIEHAYTHFKVQLHVFRCERTGGDVVLDGPTDYRWVGPEELDNFAFPKANHKFINELKKP